MTPRARRWLLAVAVALSAGAPCGALAEGRRVLFVTGPPSPFSARVRAEIEAMGFEIVPAAILADNGADAVAAARVIESPARRVELWITDPATGRLALRAFVTPSPDGDDASETVRASEQLRAFFQPLREPTPPLSVAPPPSSPLSVAPPPRSSLPVAPPPPSSLAVAPSPPSSPAPSSPAPPPASPSAGPRFVVGANVAVPFQPGGPGLDLGLHGRWMAARVLGVGAFVSVPLAGSTVNAREGSAGVSAPLFGAELTLASDVTPRLRLSTSAGLGAAWVRTSGFASAPYQGKPSNVVAALAMLGAGIAPRLTERTHLCFDGHLGFSLPRVDIAFVGRPVATWGRPLGVLSAGVSVDL
jgi:hypothetical protein